MAPRLRVGILAGCCFRIFLHLALSVLNQSSLAGSVGHKALLGVVKLTRHFFSFDKDFNWLHILKASHQAMTSCFLTSQLFMMNSWSLPVGTFAALTDFASQSTFSREVVRRVILSAAQSLPRAALINNPKDKGQFLAKSSPGVK